ncbi:MAG: co-chaperone GroES family protein [candidate division KSB1 bacterium]|nr:co-chaperone GroES family protein [candidate division KSB1 bacterium]MDZ7334716.1 co-chaperone GroES family protein [candidate division KSB1 bacterium]MDZ7356220.1 co-chaperone GroES family protein [candidate division KSB1 bacterium]MDZ7375586.1 co-chaperone GroES family protein [candidate division KSB1 bacterium]MDZ7400363.1 co-chaperone GroES family protein [candidate division KSB1 bacterium]
MMKKEKEIIIIGDRVLISPDPGKDRTDSGLYLPQGVAEKEKISSGYVVKVGPGYIIPYIADTSEPWKGKRNETHYIPLQVRIGDYAIFLRKDAIEIEYDEKRYLIISQSSILAVVRSKILPDDDE